MDMLVAVTQVWTSSVGAPRRCISAAMMAQEKVLEMSFEEQGGCLMREMAWKGSVGGWVAGPLEGTTQETCVDRSREGMRME